MAEKPKPKPVEAVRRIVEGLLADRLDDATLRSRLEEIAVEPAFGALTPLWGPALYGRNRVVFRPFILGHFATFELVPHFRRIPWKGATASALDGWLSKAEGDGDVEMSRRLYEWKLSSLDRKEAATRWRNDLLSSFGAARNRTERSAVLARFDLWYRLDEPSAHRLYETDAQASRQFVLRHLPSEWTFIGEKRRLWKGLGKLARDRGDREFEERLFRLQAPVDVWISRALELANDVKDPSELCRRLEAIHIEGWSLDLGDGILRLVEARGRDVAPYLLAKANQIWTGWGRSKGSLGTLLDEARAEGWWDIWAALLRSAGSREDFDGAVTELVADRSTDETTVRKRLLMLAGVSGEWHLPGLSLLAVRQLAEPTALALYARFPDLLRGPFRKHVSLTLWNPYPRLVDEALAASDEVLIDFLASRAVIANCEWSRQGKPFTVAETLSRHFESLSSDPVVFSRRAAAVLNQVPAYSISGGFDGLVRSNRLARLLFERSPETFLSDAVAVRDVLEAPEIHCQALALKVLGLPTARSRELARENLDLLQATLLRPLHRRTRLLAFEALRNAATSEKGAVVIYRRAREALDLPEKGYPREQLIGLLADLLHRWPSLRARTEVPLVYRRAS